MPLLARRCLGAGIAATIGSNLAHGLGRGPIGVLVSAWPALPTHEAVQPQRPPTADTSGDAASPPLPSSTITDMSVYNGQAVILTEDDMEVPVSASLHHDRSGLRTAWSGTLTPADDPQQVLNLTKGRLRLPDGREADFLRPNTSDWVGTNRLTIIGQNDAPF